MGRDGEGGRHGRVADSSSEARGLGFYKEQCHVYTIAEVAAPGSSAFSNIPATDLWISTGWWGAGVKNTENPTLLNCGYQTPFGVWKLQVTG